MKTPGHVVPAKKALRHQAFVAIGEAVVGGDLFLRLGVFFLEILANHVGQVPAQRDGWQMQMHRAPGRQTHVWRARRPSSGRRNNLGDALSSSGAARRLDWAFFASRNTCCRRDSQSPSTRAAARRTLRLQKNCLGGRAVGKLPAQVLDVQTVVVELMLKLSLRAGPGGRLKQAFVQSLPGPNTPGVEFRRREHWRCERTASPGLSPTKPAAQGP